MQAAREGVLPLRPLTVGELLDAAGGVLRRCGWPLLAVGLLLSLARVGLVLVLAGLLGVLAGTPQPAAGQLWWVCAACWLGSETAVLAVLAAPAAGAAVAALTGADAGTGTARLRLLTAPGARWPVVLGIAVCLGALGTLAALMCGLPWLLLYAVTGLVVPAVVADRIGPSAAPRPFRLVFAGGARPAGVRLLGWLSWAVVRLAVGVAGGYLLARFAVGDAAATSLLALLPWILADTVAMPALACLDACIHLENRIRVEGLDIAMRRGFRPGPAAGAP